MQNIPLALRERHPLKHGAVFLPAAGNRNGTSVNNVGSNGNYWSSSPNGSDNAYNLNFNGSNLNMNNNNRYNGQSVRLVSASENSSLPVLWYPRPIGEKDGVAIFFQSFRFVKVRKERRLQFFAKKKKKCLFLNKKYYFCNIIIPRRWKILRLATSKKVAYLLIYYG